MKEFVKRLATTWGFLQAFLFLTAKDTVLSLGILVFILETVILSLVITIIVASWETLLRGKRDAAG